MYINKLDFKKNPISMHLFRHYLNLTKWQGTYIFMCDIYAKYSSLKKLFVVIAT